jgi:hypothetical protein
MARLSGAIPARLPQSGHDMTHRESRLHAYALGAHGVRTPRCARVGVPADACALPAYARRDAFALPHRTTTALISPNDRNFPSLDLTTVTAWKQPCDLQPARCSAWCSRCLHRARGLHQSLRVRIVAARWCVSCSGVVSGIYLLSVAVACHMSYSHACCMFHCCRARTFLSTTWRP